MDHGGIKEYPQYVGKFPSSPALPMTGDAFGGGYGTREQAFSTPTPAYSVPARHEDGFAGVGAHPFTKAPTAAKVVAVANPNFDDGW